MFLKDLMMTYTVVKVHRFEVNCHGKIINNFVSYILLSVDFKALNLKNLGFPFVLLILKKFID